ncbi:MAG: hypothetical protein AVDCRST_MAG17-1671, partial [uncultured Solirubrobacterales bacterium]
ERIRASRPDGARAHDRGRAPTHGSLHPALRAAPAKPHPPAHRAAGRGPPGSGGGRARAPAPRRDRSRRRAPRGIAGGPAGDAEPQAGV